MKYKILAAALLALSLFSCSKEDTLEQACNEELYGATFDIEAGETYCFEDDTELKVVALNNEFCPCNTDCFWEGQLTINMEWTPAGGETIAYLYNTASDVVANDTLPDGLALSYERGDFTLVQDCSDAVPSPEIIQARITVSK